jgi:hypothetical protein
MIDGYRPEEFLEDHLSDLQRHSEQLEARTASKLHLLPA